MKIQEKQWFLFFLVIIVMGVAAHLYRVDALKKKNVELTAKLTEMYVDAQKVFDVYERNINECCTKNQLKQKSQKSQ